MNAGRQIAGSMRTLVRLTVVGAALLMAGELTALATGLLGLRLPRGWPHALPLAASLIVGGLLCGVLVMALALPRRR